MSLAAAASAVLGLVSIQCGTTDFTLAADAGSDGAKAPSEAGTGSDSSKPTDAGSGSGSSSGSGSAGGSGTGSASGSGSGSSTGSGSGSAPETCTKAPDCNATNPSCCVRIGDGGTPAALGTCRPTGGCETDERRTCDAVSVCQTSNPTDVCCEYGSAPPVCEPRTECKSTEVCNKTTDCAQPDVCCGAATTGYTCVGAAACLTMIAGDGGVLPQ